MVKDVEIKKILVPIDGSKYGRIALDYAVTIAKGCGAYIEILSVVDLSDYISSFEQAGADMFMIKEMAHAAQDMVQEHKALVPEGIHVNTRVAQGNVRDTIVRTAEQENVDLIIMGRRGLGTLEGMILGSVSTYVVAHAPCAVLTVK